MRDFWPSVDRKMPKDEPDCGFRGERCDFTLLIVGGALILIMLLALSGAYALHRIMWVQYRFSSGSASIPFPMVEISEKKER